MSPNYLSGLWAPLASAAGNHLWQSTLFAITAGLLTLVLRQNHARARYWLWLAASAKFLIPFSLFVAIGSRLPSSPGSAETKAGLYFALEQISQPFMQPTTFPTSGPNHVAFSSHLTHVLFPLLAAVWMIGFLVVSCIWYARWRRISAAVRGTTPQSSPPRPSQTNL
jgi:bla regulator protein blaR1